MQKQIVLREVLEDIQMQKQSLKQFVKGLGKMPFGSVLIGIAQDGLPVALSVRDSKAPNIIVWNKLVRQGLRILKVIAEYLFLYHKSDHIEFVVFTTHPKDWGELNEYGYGTNSKTACIGIIPFHSDLATVVMRGLATWTHESHKAPKAPVIILMDGMENLEGVDEEFRFNFRYILLKGKDKYIYTVGTSHKKHFHLIHHWLEGFQREIYGSDVADTFEYDSTIFYTPITEMI